MLILTEHYEPHAFVDDRRSGLALGALVSFSSTRTCKEEVASTSEPGADVIVALDDIQVGARIEDHDIRIARFPASGLPAGAYSQEVASAGPRRNHSHHQGRIHFAQQAGS